MFRPPSQRWKARAGGVIVASWTLAALIATGPSLAIVWDEGYTLGREARLRAWFRALRDPAAFAATWRPPSPRDELVQPTGPPPKPGEIDTRAKLLGRDAFAWFWPFAREEPHGHPPFYALVGLIGDLVAPSWQPLPRARLGTMIAFSLAAGALFTWAAIRWGTWPAALTAGAWLLQPRLFAEGHYATYDALLTSLWVGAILAFERAVVRNEANGDLGKVDAKVGPGGAGLRNEPDGKMGKSRWGWAMVFGVLAGLAAATKLTGWFLPVPFVAWTALYRSRRGLWVLVVGGVVAALTLYAFNPPWWAEPIGGVERFFRSNLGRAKTIPIPVLFLGRVYETPTGSLPWYNTLVWTVFVTPVGFLGLALAGAVRAARRRKVEPFGVLAVLHWAALLALRALPHTPGHDGVRQFLPAFGVLAIVAGMGAAWLIEWSARWGKVVIVAALAEGVASVWLMMPVPLSYYSPAVGGLPGARALGMEPTYYWDALSEEALDWLNDNTGPGEKVLFATNPTSWRYLHQTGRLRPGWRPEDPGEWKWYVVQNRPGALKPLDRALVVRGKAVHVVEKLGVPLVWIFSYDQIRARQRFADRGGAKP